MSGSTQIEGQATPVPPQAETSSLASREIPGRPGVYKVGPLRLRRLSLPGTLLGLLLACVSATPSLVPRGWLIHGLLTGICMAVGYGLGSLAGWIYRSLGLPDLPRRVRRTIWTVIAVVTPVALLVSGFLGRRWQIQQRELLGMDTDVPWLWVLSPLLSIAITLLLLGIGRGFVWIGRKLTHWLSHLLPGRLAGVIAVTVTLALAWFVVTGVVAGNALAFADSLFKGKADDNKPGVVNPNSPYRSAGPNSQEAWESLGREGRQFIWQGRTKEQITEVTADPTAEEPIRVFVGLEAAPNPEDRAALAVAELRRLGGFDKRMIAVAGGTGSGWIDPKAAAALEFAAHGDVATVSMQYSYLPSWMSFLVDRSRARSNAAELITAIRVELDTMLPQDRPELYVYGESLGAYSTGSAFTSVEDMSTTTDGALLIGPPSFEPTWTRVQENRDPGSPLWRPRYQDGALARAAASDADITDPTLTWKTPNRIIYLTHASDPIVAWTTPRAEWIEERGPDVHPRVVAIPIVSFLQASIDQFGANAPPPGHGHVYDEIVATAWSEILGPPSLPQQEVEAIKVALRQVNNPS